MTTPTTPPEERLPDDNTALFLQTLVARKPADAHLLVWRLPDKKSRSFADLSEAHAYIASIRDDAFDVYLGVGLSDRPVASAGVRYPVNQVKGIYAFWADIDIQDEVHKKKNLPPNLFEARNLVNESGLPPTLVVFTGHGLQAWWVLDEPWMFGDAGRNDAIALVTQWLYAIKTRAHLHGWEVDSTQDLSRVLRVVGSMNHKAEPVEVNIMDYNPDALYTLDDIKHAIAESPIDVTQTNSGTGQAQGHLPPSTERVRYVANGLVIDSQAQPPFDKWNSLIAENPNAQRTFDHKRELSSTSEYDFALAVMAIQASMCDEPWTDQEITDLLIAHRRGNKLDLKLRATYYAMTIMNARARVNARWATEDLATAYQEHMASRLDASRRDAAATAATSKKAQGDEAAKITPFTKGAAAPVLHPADADADADAASEADMDADVGADVDTGDTFVPSTPQPAPKVDPKWASYLAAIGGAGQDEEIAPSEGAVPQDIFSIDGRETDEMDAQAIERAAAINRLGNGATAERVLKGLGSIFRIFSVLRVVKFAATPPVYNLVIRMNDTQQQMAVNVGGIEGLTSFRQFRNRVAENTSILIEPQKSEDWDNIVRWILAIAEVESIGDEATEQGQIRSWLETYLTRYPIDRDWTQEMGPPAEGAFLYTDRVHITSKHLLWWLKNNEGEKLSAKILGQMLRSIGCETVTVPFKRPDGKRTSCAAWRIPHEVAADFLTEITVSDE